MRVCVTLKSGEVHNRQIDGSFCEKQGVVYATYGRLNIERIQFCLGNGRWIDSPYGTRKLESIP